MASLRLRDRDAIITREGLIFRVFGYSHPPNAYICDAEYAPAELFKSDNPKAFRSRAEWVFYKFYEDEGWNFVHKKFPQYTILHGALGKRVVGVNCSDAVEIRKPEEKLEKLIEEKPRDALVTALQNILGITTQHSGLPTNDFGIFGSMLHGFYHPKFSDIDLIIYGRKNMQRLCEALQEVYKDYSSLFKNEFETDMSVKGKRWKFKNYSLKEYLLHQRRKMVYAVFRSKALQREVKVEFEPVKEWNEVRDEYSSVRKIIPEGWVKAIARVKDDMENAFMPSIYPVEIVELIDGPKVDDIGRIVSYVEEFRMQAWKDEVVYVEGNLEKVQTVSENSYQVTLTYGPRYYKQVLKSLNSD